MKYFLFFMFFSFNLFAGEGHDHGESAFSGSSGIVKSFDLSHEEIANLDIKTQVVKTDVFKQSLSLPCVISNPPEQKSQIHTTYLGEIKKIGIRIGDRVQKGQILYTIFSFKAVRELEIIAPIDGIISAQNVSLGQIVQMETILAEITTNNHFIAEGLAYLSDDISHIKIGDLSSIKIDGTHEDVVGLVQGFAPNVNKDNKTKSVFVEFKSRDEHIFPNMHCQMDIYYGEEENNISVPKRAVLGDFGNYFVFSNKDSHFERRPVILGHSSGDTVEIVSGLSEGENIVINGNYQLQYIKAKNE